MAESDHKCKVSERCLTKPNIITPLQCISWGDVVTRQMDIEQFSCNNNNGYTTKQELERLINEQEPDARYECAICMNWLDEPVLTSCGHRFCKTCLDVWLRDNRQWCPMDNERITGDQDVFPDNFTRREIEQIKLKCPNAKLGCELIASPLEVERHRYNCPHRFTEKQDDNDGHSDQYGHHHSEEKCPFASIKCDFVGRPETNALEVHLKEDMALHLQLMLKALQHTAISTWNPEKSTDLTQQQQLKPLLNGHLELNNGEDADVKLLSGSILPPSQYSNATEEQLLQAMYQRIVVLEQRACEQDVKIENLTKQLIHSNNQNQKIVSDGQGVINNGLSLDSHYSNGTILWEISNFPKLVEYLQSNANNLIYSRECYTSPYGYKFCARLNIQPKSLNMLSLHVHLMQSENDYHLDWPFNGRIRLCIVHPTDAKLSQHDTVMTNPEILAFHKPRERISTRGFGFVEYANISELMRKGFCDKSGRLVIKIQINIV